jgi:hypothetical protein
MNPEAGSIFETPRGGRYIKLPSKGDALPNETDNQLLRRIASEIEETNSRLAKIEKELLGSEGDREGGLVFRLARIEQQLAILWFVAGTSATVAIGLLITKLAGLMGAP